MKILLVSPTPPPAGGIATWTSKFLHYCDEHGVEVDLVNTALIGARGNRINHKRCFRDEVTRTFRILKQMRKGLESNPDIVHLNSSCSTFGIIRDYLCALLAFRKLIPLVFHCHCNVEDQIQKTIGVKILKRILDISTLVFVLNSSSKEYVSSLGRNNVVIIPNFIEGEMICKEHIISSNIENVVFVGHVQRTKGVFEIIETAKIMNSICFHLVGPVSDEITNSCLPDNIVIHGSKGPDEVKNFLDKADLFLFPSYTEGFSLSLLEAMANGLPCIATDVGSNKDMLENKGGIIIVAKDVNSIVSAIDSLSAKDKRKEMSDWNVEKVRHSYTMDAVLNKMFQLYMSNIV